MNNPTNPTCPRRRHHDLGTDDSSKRRTAKVVTGYRSPRRQPRHRRRPLAILLLALGVIALTACSRSSDAVNTATGVNHSADQSSATAAPSNAEAAGDAIRDLKTTVYLNGFEIELGAIKKDPLKKRVLVDAVVHNLGKGDAASFGDVLLVAANNQKSTGGWTDNSTIAGGQQRPQQLYISMDPAKLDLASSTLVLGTAKKQQVRVPLDDPHAAITLAPTPIQGPFTPIAFGDVTITPKTIETRFDAKHTEADADKAYIVVSGSIESTDHSHGWDPKKVKLTAPDGKTTAPEDITPVSMNANIPTDDFGMRFVVDAPVRGTYKIDLGEQKFTTASKPVTTEPITITFPER